MRTSTLLQPVALRSALGASIAVIALGLTACSSSGSGTSATTPAPIPSKVASLPGTAPASTPAVSTPAVSTPDTSSSSPAPSTSAPGGSATLTAKLLTVKDVGFGFTEVPLPTKDATSPCDPKGTPGVNEQVPPTIKVGRDFVQKTIQAQLEEDLQSYSDEATAAKALNALKEGLNCAKGTLYADDGTTIAVAISAPKSIPAEGPVQAGEAWSLKGSGLGGLAVAVKYSDTHIALLTFFAPANTAPSKLPDIETVVATATKKFLS